MTAAYSADALWMKARLFINRAMDPGDHRSFDERALWASLSLELLAKAALARHSPLLIAVPTEDGRHLLTASGLLEGQVTFQSAPAKTVFARCALAFRPFNEAEAMKIATGRNEYLHAGGAAITPLPPHAWWPKFWAQAVILLQAQDRAVEEFVGQDRVSFVDGHLALNREHLHDRVVSMCERSRQRLALYEQGLMTTRQVAQWEATAVSADTLRYSVGQLCPACGSTGALEGGRVLSREVLREQVDGEHYEAWVELTVGSDRFSCPRCHLVLDSLELVTEAGLPDSFATEGDLDEYDEPDDYGND